MIIYGKYMVNICMSIILVCMIIVALILITVGLIGVILIKIKDFIKEKFF